MYLIAIDTLLNKISKEGQEGGHQNSRTPFLDHQYLIRAGQRVRSNSTIDKEMTNTHWALIELLW
jgi:hypothetical protein